MDTIGDFCTCIRNATFAGHDKVDVPNSNIRKGIAEKLKQHGYIRGYGIVDDGRQGLMRIYLKYDIKRNSAISVLKRVSKPSYRHYVKSVDIPDVLSGYGLAILSTNRGILTGEEAKKNNVGGEVLCEVW